MRHSARLAEYLELCGVTAVVLVMINVLHKLAKQSGSDERAILVALVTVTASIGGAILFEALIS